MPDHASQHATTLVRGVAALGLSLDAVRVQQLLDYLTLLARWNRAYNLTAVRETGQMVTRHLLDSLSILALLRGRTLLDVGSGAGAPGLVLAIASPERDVTLLDPALKRTRFLNHVVQELGLDNVAVQRVRLDAYRPTRRFDSVTSRAALTLEVLAMQAPRLLAADGRLIAMLGRAPTRAVLDCAAPRGWCIDLNALHVPGLLGERHAALVRRQ
jgi:16S rRNA (guanine527-N7)-methyltransferase